jgi:hydroxyacylglutathione hydrolase
VWLRGMFEEEHSLRAQDVERRRIVDVRQASEHATGHVAGAVHVELGALAGNPDRFDGEPVLLHCGHG